MPDKPAVPVGEWLGQPKSLHAWDDSMAGYTFAIFVGLQSLRAGGSLVPGVIGRDALYNLAAYVIPKGRKLRKRAATLASLSIASTLAAVSLGLYMAHYQSTMH